MPTVSRITSLAPAVAAAGLLYAIGRSRPAGRDARPRPAGPPAGLPPARTVAIPGRGEMFARDAPGPAGSETTILLLHGWIYPADVNWFTCYEALAEIGRVLAPDHRGHGRGLRSPQPFRLVDAADDLAGMLRALDAGPVVAVGYSMGGALAQLLWRRHPDLVSALVLCATSDTFALTPRDRWVWRAMGGFQVLLKVLPRHWLDALALRQAEGRLPVPVTRMLPSDAPAEMKALIPWMIGELNRGSAEDIAEAGRELGRYDARGWLNEIDVPAAVVITARDWLVPAVHQRAMAARLPGASVYELDLDHNAVFASPEQFVPVLAKAIREVTGQLRAPGGQSGRTA